MDDDLTKKVLTNILWNKRALHQDFPLRQFTIMDSDTLYWYKLTFYLLCEITGINSQLGFEKKSVIVRVVKDGLFLKRNRGPFDFYQKIMSSSLVELETTRSFTTTNSRRKHLDLIGLHPTS
jgi:hypothetical protein